MTLADLFRREKKPKISTKLSADEAQSFFEAFGVDMETIGFPCMNLRSGVCVTEDMRHVAFENLGATRVNEDGTVKTIISGNYSDILAMAYKESGIWRPGTPFRYSFTIQDGELNLRERR